MLTNEEYLFRFGNVCPFCESECVNAGPIQADGQQAWDVVVCEECGEQWRDYYTLSGYEVSPD